LFAKWHGLAVQHKPKGSDAVVDESEDGYEAEAVSNHPWNTEEAFSPAIFFSPQQIETNRL
jgi:hypothetical protein